MTEERNVPLCEVFVDRVGEKQPQCGNRAEYEYPAMGGGWMRLCAAHAQKHLSTATLIGMKRIGDSGQ